MCFCLAVFNMGFRPCISSLSFGWLSSSSSNLRLGRLHSLGRFLRLVLILILHRPNSSTFHRRVRQNPRGTNELERDRRLPGQARPQEVVDHRPDLEDVVRRAVDGGSAVEARRPEAVRVVGPKALRVIAEADVPREVILVRDAGEADAARALDVVRAYWRVRGRLAKRGPARGHIGMKGESGCCEVNALKYVVGLTNGRGT